MNESNIHKWLADVLPKHTDLTNTVVNIIESLLRTNNIDYLAVTGRTKNEKNIKEKIKRKNYSKPNIQLTDISGIRIIAYFESDVEKIASLIETSFKVDKENSLSKDSLLATDQIGYRSIHFVCELGKKRTTLPEFSELKKLKFEFQVRTVLQHAWAELAHDRNYKFSGKLPPAIERKLYLYAGMLELADKGFDELSTDIDLYIDDYEKRTSEGDFNIDLNSLSLEEFIDSWVNKNDFPIEEGDPNKKDYIELVNELNEFGIRKISDLMDIIPVKYSSTAKSLNYTTNVFGLVRDWMLLHDYKRYYNDVSYNWSITDPASEGMDLITDLLSTEQYAELFSLFRDDSIDFEAWEAE